VFRNSFGKSHAGGQARLLASDVFFAESIPHHSAQLWLVILSEAVAEKFVANSKRLVLAVEFAKQEPFAGERQRHHFAQSRLLRRAEAGDHFVADAERLVLAVKIVKRESLVGERARGLCARRRLLRVVGAGNRIGARRRLHRERQQSLLPTRNPLSGGEPPYLECLQHCPGS
jgi:hypothetical protein